jgi:hypothetical protein
MKYLTLINLLFMIWGMTGCRSDTLIGLNQDIRHDDFKYRVSSYEKRKSINSGNSGIMAKGTFLIVNFLVENDAMRVNHEWDNSIAYITGGGGKICENNVDAQRLLNEVEPFHWQGQYTTPHGNTESTRLVFDIPDDLHDPCLKMRGSMLMGDVFNLNRFKRMRIKLY